MQTRTARAFPRPQPAPPVPPAGPMAKPTDFFLVIDDRYGAPIYVFLEVNPTGGEDFPRLRGSWVTLQAPAGPDTPARDVACGLAANAAIGGDPRSPDRFVVFAGDSAVRAAGYTLIEPRYLGPNWDSYLKVFHPEGGR